MSTRYCASCTKEISADASFCSNCGKEVPPLFNPRNNASFSSHETNNFVKKRSKSLVFGIIFISFMLFGYFAYTTMRSVAPAEEIKLETMEQKIETPARIPVLEESNEKIEGVSDKTKQELIEKDPTNILRKKIAKSLLGRKKFGVQFIYDGYGTAEIKDLGGALTFKGSQFSKNREEFTRMEGTLIAISDSEILFNGTLEIFTNDCCGPIAKTGIFTFRKTGTRKYWRLKDFNDLCDQYTCAYYLDIFE
jgi:hypothetical protein